MHAPLYFIAYRIANQLRRWRRPIALLALGLLGSSGVQATDPALVSAAIRDLTEAPTRIVWRQDMDDNIDAGASEAHARLMAFDSEDGRGERALLPTLGNYSRPLITPRGERVIFSDRRVNKIYIVNWDGSKLKFLSDGYAAGVWCDPASGVEWVYSGQWATNADALQSILRAPIDQPDQMEIVWDRTLLHPDNFQLSADGQLASGTFPWPACGIAELPNRHWRQYATGCWPSLAPENQGLLWVFDGAHRNLTIFRIGTEEHWQININRAPGVGGYEVYHPRWSNRAHCMVMTGPYKLGTDDNRIRGGGPEVEIFIGRFAADFRTIERWVRVTHNAYADFCPDVWIADPLVTAAPAPPPRLPPVAMSPAWPGNTDELIFIWEHRGRQNEILDATGTAGRSCRIEPRGAARYGRYLEMDLGQGIFTAETEAAAHILAACRHSSQFSLEAVLTPRQLTEPANLEIVALTSAEQGNFILSQAEDQLLWRLHTLPAQELGPPMSVGRLRAQVPQHVIISYAPGQLSCFVDGAIQTSTNAPEGGLASWISGELVFGDRQRGWPGGLEYLALYSRAISAPEAQQKYELLKDKLEARTPATRLVVEARLLEATPIPDLASIAPYRRALVVDRYNSIKIIKGVYTEQQLLAARWGILDGQTPPTAARHNRKRYRLILEPFEEHPELEGERLIMDSAAFLLPLYYEVE
ncbi:MAG: LamG domain-containing protein [Lentisphaerae bacterium]|nr:LamG domain-containing protein [Lentisphaerota bacterium]